MDHVVRQKNYLVESILVTIFCCLPLGIVGIVHASKVNGFYDSGDVANAEKSSAEAYKWVKLAFIIGLVVNLLVIVGYIIMIVAAVGSGGF